jgi:hypothetical protein
MHRCSSQSVIEGARQLAFLMVGLIRYYRKEKNSLTCIRIQKMAGDDDNFVP